MIRFVGDAVSDLCAKHHLGALHSIVNAVLQSWLKRILVDKIEIYEIVTDNLDPNISFDIVDLATHIFFFAVLGPETGFFVNFKEKNGP